MLGGSALDGSDQVARLASPEDIDGFDQLIGETLHRLAAGARDMRRQNEIWPIHDAAEGVIQRRRLARRHVKRGA